MNRIPAHRFSPSFGSPILATRRLGVLALLLALGAGPGCKMMTDAQLAALKDEQKAQEAQSNQEQTNSARLQKVDKERQQLQFRIDDRDARTARMQRFDEARMAFDAGNATEALEIIDAILAADAESVELYAAARAEGNEDPYLSRTVEVEDPKAAVPAAGGTSAKIVKEELIPTPMDDRDKAMILVLRGAARYTSGQTTAGIADFETASKLDPANRVARINFGKLLFEQQEWRAALAAWKAELEEGYRSAELLELIGQALFELARETEDPSLIEASRQALLEAFVANPEKESLVRWLGRLEYHSERYEEAARYFEGILARHPLDPAHLELCANCYLELDRLRDAADQFELLVRVSHGQDLERVQKTLVGLYAQMRLPDRAATWLRRAYEGREMPSDARYDLVLFLNAAEKFEDALREVERIPSDAEEYAEAQGIAAEMEITLRRFDDAATRLSRLVDLAPGDGRVRLSAGDLAMQRKEYEAALRYFNLAAAIPDTKARGLASAAEAYYEIGNLAKAIDYYQDAVEAAPENASYLAALGEIKTEHEFRTQAAKADSP